MALDADTHAARASRKTLDDIRRELDAEFGTLPITDAAPIGEDEAAVGRFDQPGAEAKRCAPRRTTGRAGYIIGGVIGCIAGQLRLLGGLTVMHYRATPGPAGARIYSEAAAPRVPVAPPASDAAVSEPPARASEPSATVSEPPARPFVPPATTRASVADAHKPVPRRVVKPPPAVSSPRLAVSALRSEPEARVIDSEDWVKSQEEVRAALSEWLATSGLRNDSVVSDTVVFLGADGRTARTHVPMRWGGGVIIREQRWEREANGWSLVEDREAWRVR